MDPVMRKMVMMNLCKVGSLVILPPENVETRDTDEDSDYE